VSAVYMLREIAKKSSRAYKERNTSKQSSECNKYKAECTETQLAKQIVEMMRMMMEDVSSTVRKRAVASEDVLRAYYTVEMVESITKKALEDAEDTVRCQFIYPLRVVIEKKEDSTAFVDKVFRTAIEDISWQVRMVATKIAKTVIEQTYKKEECSTESKEAIVVQGIGRLVEDKEKLVRHSIVQEMPGIVQSVPETKEKIVGYVQKAAKDASSQIRRTMPEVIAQVSKVLTKEEVQEHMWSVMQQLLADEDKETKMETIAKMCAFYTKLGPDAIAGVLAPIIADLNNTSWRARLAVLRSIAAFSTQIDAAYFETHLEAPFYRMLVDRVWAVRKEAAEMLADICSVFGPAWTAERAVQALKALKCSTHYMHRISYVHAAVCVLERKCAGDAEKTLVKGLEELSDDTIVQVRMSVAYTLNKSVWEGKDAIVAKLRTDKAAEVVRACL